VKNQGVRVPGTGLEPFSDPAKLNDSAAFVDRKTGSEPSPGGRGSAAAVAAGALASILLSACAQLQSAAPSATDRLCGADAGCRDAVARAPELQYPHVDQAVSAGLAWALEQPETQRPQWKEIGFAVYGEPGAYRIELAAGDDENVRVNLRAGAVALAHVHPMPLLRECSAQDRLSAARVDVPVYLQHPRTGIIHCAPLRVAGQSAAAAGALETQP
jgi:hypothetical protein